MDLLDKKYVASNICLSISIISLFEASHPVLMLILKKKTQFDNLEKTLESHF